MGGKKQDGKTLFMVLRESRWLFLTRGGGGYKSYCLNNLLEQIGRIFQGSLSHKEAGIKHCVFSIMHLWLFIFTACCSLLGAKLERFPIYGFILSVTLSVCVCMER